MWHSTATMRKCLPKVQILCPFPLADLRDFFSALGTEEVGNFCFKYIKPREGFSYL